MPFRICILLLCLIIQSSRAQQDSSKALTPRKETDLIDIAQKNLKKTLMRHDTAKKTAGKIYFSGSPSPGYSLSSGWVGLVVANGAFYTDNDKAAKISNVYTDA